jgi:iron complex outermembrane recepter protein
MVRLPLLLVLVAVAPLAAAQPGTLSGTVLDADGRPVAYANVGVEGAPLGAATDERGRFLVLNVPAGERVVRASYVGFEPARQAVTVPAGAAVEVTLELAQRLAELGEVTVTGVQRRTSAVTKTMTPLEDLPISVQIVGEEVFHAQQVTDLRDVVRNMSGVTATGTYNGGYVYYNSRGFDMNNWANFRRNGMFVWNMGHHYADNIERVEVLKGPASVLYGDVAPGGVMNFVTKKPLAYPYRRAELRVGQYGLVRPTVDLSGPVTADGRVLYRLNATYERSDSFRDEVESEAALLAPSLTWVVAPQLRWTVEGTYRRDERVGDPGLISPDGTFAGLRRLDRSTFLGEPSGTYSFEDKGLYSTADLFLSDRWTLRNTTYLTDTYRTPYNIYLSGTAADEDGFVSQRQYFFNQWFRGWGTDLGLSGEFASGSVAHQVVVGVDYLFNHSRYTEGANGPIAADINVFDPRYGQSPLTPDPMAWADKRFFYRRLGLYVQDQVSLLGGRLQALAGLRFNVSTTGDRYDDPADAPEGYAPVTERPLSPRLGLVGKPLSWLSLYGSYAESFEVNGPDWIDPTVLVPPTTARQVEAGAKANLLGGRLGVTGSVFQLEKEDVYHWVDAETAPAFPHIAFDEEWGWATYQGGLHRSRGVEVDVNGRVGEALSVVASAAYIETEIVEDPAYAPGRRLSGQPRVSASAWATYAVPHGRLAGLELGGGVFHRGRFFQSTDNDPAGEVSPYSSLDLTAAYTLGRTTARLTVQNALDPTGYLSSFGVYEPLWPRRALLSVATRF